MTDYLISEDVFMALTGDITDCTIEEFIARLRDKLSKLSPVIPKEKTGWIPVSERLPEDDYGTYLICTDDGYIATIQYDRSMGWLLDGNIIAWMPLPELYEGGRE